jgi:hypothetical protein
MPNSSFAEVIKKKKTSRIRLMLDCPMFSGGEKNRSTNLSALIGSHAGPL